MPVPLPRTAASHKGGGSDPIDTATTSVAGLMSAGDASALVTLENNLPVVVTVPNDQKLNVPTGTVIELMQLGSGQVSVAGLEVTIKSKDDHKKLTAQYSQATLLKTAANTWVLTGDLSA